MEENILISIRQFLNIDADDENFDAILIPLINSAFNVLAQLGVIDEGIRMDDTEMTWEEVIGENVDRELLKEYVAYRTKILFDPPSSSFVLEAMKQMVADDEWRLRAQAELKEMDKS